MPDASEWKHGFDPEYAGLERAAGSLRGIGATILADRVELAIAELKELRHAGRGDVERARISVFLQTEKDRVPRLDPSDEEAGYWRGLDRADDFVRGVICPSGCEHPKCPGGSLCCCEKYRDDTGIAKAER